LHLKHFGEVRSPARMRA